MARTKYTVTFPAAKAGDRVTVDQDAYLESDSRTVTRRLDLNESQTAVFYSDAASVTVSWKPRGGGSAVTLTVTTGAPTKTATGSDVGVLTRAEASASYAPVARPNTIIPFGTSLTNQGYAGTTQPIGATWAKGYLAVANVQLGHRFRMLNNAGVSGNTSAQMLARIQADVLAFSPAYCVVESGCPNDIGNALTLAQSIANHQAIYDALKAAGVRVVVCTPVPYGLADTVNNRTFISGLRRWQIAYALQQGHKVCDWYPSLVKTDGTGAWVTNYDLDSVHPSPLGAKIMGTILANALRDEKAEYAGLWLPTGNADPYNLLANGMMIGTGGTAGPAGTSGSVATSWTPFNAGGTSAATLSKVARTDGVQGEWQQIAFTAGNADELHMQQQNTGIGTAFNVGDSVLLTAEFQVDQDWVAGLDVRLSLQFFGPSTNVQDLARSSGDVGVGQPPAPGGVLLVTGVVPATTTRLQAQLYSKMTTGTIRWGRCGLYNLTAMAAAGAYTAPALGWAA